MLLLVAVVAGCESEHVTADQQEHTSPPTQETPVHADPAHQQEGQEDSKSAASADSEKRSVLLSSAAEFAVAAPTFSQPVTAGMQVEFTEFAYSAVTKLEANLRVKLRIANGFHVYGQLAEGTPFQPLKIDVQLPDGGEFVTGWAYPNAAKEGGLPVYYREVVLERKVRLPWPQQASTQGTVSFQACNEDACLLPATLPLSSPPD